MPLPLLLVAQCVVATQHRGDVLGVSLDQTVLGGKSLGRWIEMLLQWHLASRKNNRHTGSMTETVLLLNKRWICWLVGQGSMTSHLPNSSRILRASVICCHRQNCWPNQHSFSVPKQKMLASFMDSKGGAAGFLLIFFVFLTSNLTSLSFCETGFRVKSEHTNLEQCKSRNCQTSSEFKTPRPEECRPFHLLAS